MPHLIVTADDFGLSPEVNEAVERAYRNGILTATSLMVSGPAAADAVERARRLTGLGIGLHLVLTDGVPTLPPEQLPHLVGPDGRFRNDMLAGAMVLVASRSARLELAAEIRAQFEAFAKSGLAFDHVNAHRHFHLHPIVAEIAFRLAARYRVPATRVPDEPLGLVRLAEPATPGRGNRVLLPIMRYLRWRARSSDLATADRVVGLAWSGAFTRDRLAGVLAQLPGGSTELYFHPAIADDIPGGAPGYRYRAELEALLDPEVMRLAGQPGIRRTAYGALRHG